MPPEPSVTSAVGRPRSMHLEVLVGAVAEELRATRPEIGEAGDELLGRRGGRLVQIDRGTCLSSFSDLRLSRGDWTIRVSTGLLDDGVDRCHQGMDGPPVRGNDRTSEIGGRDGPLISGYREDRQAEARGRCHEVRERGASKLSAPRGIQNENVAPGRHGWARPTDVRSIFDDRTTDEEPDTHAVGLRRVEGIEQ